MNDIKYIAYCRKSTDEKDRQVLSIEAQQAELKEFATKEGLKITEYIIESKTAKEPGREKFQQLIKAIEKGKASGIVAWHPDRLARNSVDGGKIIYLLDTGKLKNLKFPTFWFENTPQGKFMLNIAFGQSKYYVDNLSENVKRGNRQKLRRGEWPNQAPFGYLNNKASKAIKLDPKRSKYVKKAFELFSTGGYLYIDIQRYWTKNKIFNPSGKVVKTDKIKRILTNPFYYGIMQFCGELYEGKHKPLISKKLFDKVQKVVKLKSRKYQSNKEKFDFLGLAICSECGASITAEKHIKHYKRTNRTVKYTYYRCSKKKGYCSQKYISITDVQKQIKDIVLKASLKKDEGRKFLEWAEKDSLKDKVKNAGQTEKLNFELKTINQKLDKLLEGYLSEIISEADYKKKKNELVQTKALLKQKIKEIQTKGSEWFEPFQKFTKLALRARKIARKNKNGHDLAIMAQTVGSNFFLKEPHFARAI